MCWTAGQVSNAVHAAPEEGEKRDARRTPCRYIVMQLEIKMDGFREEEFRS